MSDDAVVPFIGEYEVSVDDLREQDIIGRTAAWRAKPLVSRWAYPVLSLALAAVTISVNQETAGCFIPQSTPSQAPYQVWLWQCDPTVTPNGLVWQDVWLFAAAGAAARRIPPRVGGRAKLKATIRAAADAVMCCGGADTGAPLQSLGSHWHLAARSDGFSHKN